MPQALPTQFDPLLDGWTETRGQRALMTQFGDGYSQRSPDGLNTLIETHKFSLYAGNQADANVLQDFLDARGMVDAIVMQMPGSASAKNYLQIAPYQKTFLGNGAYLFSIEVRWDANPQPSINSFQYPNGLLLDTNSVLAIDANSYLRIA
ncbi:MAG: phage tail protein [Xenococcaceae cyanobacterium]